MSRLDDTERVQTKDALRENEKRLRAIWKTAVEGIITIDERGSIESRNPAASRIFGYTPEEIVGRNVSVLMPSPDREKHDSYIANYLRTSKAKIIGIGREVVGQRKDGTTFPMELSVCEVGLGERRLFTGFVRDISERRRLEQARGGGGTGAGAHCTRVARRTRTATRRTALHWKAGARRKSPSAFISAPRPWTCIVCTSRKSSASRRHRSSRALHSVGCVTGEAGHVSADMPWNCPIRKHC